MFYPLVICQLIQHNDSVITNVQEHTASVRVFQFEEVYSRSTQDSKDLLFGARTPQHAATPSAEVHWMDNDTETIVLGSGKKRRKKSQQNEGRPAKRAAASMAPEVPEVRKKKKKKKKKLEQQQQPDSGRADSSVAESQNELSGEAGAKG